MDGALLVEMHPLNNPGALDMCEALHGARHGSSDPLNPHDQRWFLTALKEKLESWDRSPDFTQRYDDAVKALIEATLAEWE